MSAQIIDLAAARRAREELRQARQAGEQLLAGGMCFTMTSGSVPSAEGTNGQLALNFGEGSVVGSDSSATGNA